MHPTWESLIPRQKRDCHNQSADWSRNDTGMEIATTSLRTGFAMTQLCCVRLSACAAMLPRNDTNVKAYAQGKHSVHNVRLTRSLALQFLTPPSYLSLRVHTLEQKCKEGFL